jgi:uncharacterized membrane protein YgcG
MSSHGQQGRRFSVWHTHWHTNAWYFADAYTHLSGTGNAKVHSMKILPFSLALGCSLLASAVALADVPPPDTFSCTKTGSVAGSACTTDAQKAGVCQAKKCTRLDYSMRDAGGPPPSIEYDCLTCVAGSGGTSTDGGATSSGGTTSGGGCSFGGGAGSLSLGFAAALGLLISRRKRSV